MTEYGLTKFLSRKGTKPTAAVIAEVDTLVFSDLEDLTARNMLLTQNSNNLEITFEGKPQYSTYDPKVTLICSIQDLGF